MRDLLRKSPRFFLIVALAGLALRLIFVLHFPSITDDSYFYGDIAKNWLQHGIYGSSELSGIHPTNIRLPGYPAFLALIFTIFGMEHYRAVLVVQMFVDLGTCLLIADLARRTISERAAKLAFLLAALCPFLANYAAAALTETLEIFFTALTLDLAIVGLDNLPQPRLRPWAGCGLAVAAAILLRPDGGLLLIAIGVYLLFLLLRGLSGQTRAGIPMPHLLAAGLTLAAVSLAPLIPWTVRNLITLHVFEPLAPRYANQPNEYVPAGFHRWVKTWMVDYVSVEEIYWQAPGNAIDATKLPSRAFDSESQRQETVALIADYNQVQRLDPPLDARFANLADQRIARAPLRYYVWLPFLRVADMWLRPRTELLPSDTRWWEFNDDPQWLAVTLSLGALNLAYIGAAALGVLRWRSLAYAGLLILFVALRSAFLGTLENPEPRYTLEAYPAIIIPAVAAFLTSGHLTEIRMRSSRF